MKFFWFILFPIAALLMKENSCVPAIRPLSQRGILFPVDNWDDCFLDEASTRPGICKRIEECPEALKKWDKENVYPKTCYFIKQQQFVCCPITATKETFTSTDNLDNIFNKNAVSTTTTLSSTFFDIFDTSVEGIFTKRPDGTKKKPSNIFLDNLNKSTTTSPNEGIFTLWPDATTTTKKRPSNIFLENLHQSATTSSPNQGIFTQRPVDTTTTKKRPSNIFLESLHQSTTPSSPNQGIFTQRPVTTTTTKKRPSNIYLEYLHQSTTTSSPNQEMFTQKPVDNTTTKKRPSNIFLEYLHQSTTPATSRPSLIFFDNVEKTTSQKPAAAIPDILNTRKPAIKKRPSELECNDQKQRKFEAIDINGPAYDLDEFPFMAFLSWKPNMVYDVWYPCTGVLISPRFVLTAAHCADIGCESPSFVNFDDKNVTGSLEGNIKIKRIIEYPGYNATTIYNNIALVELEEEVNKPFACLWTQHDLPTSQITALGYGRTIFDDLNLIQLYKLPLNVIDKEQCKNDYRITDALLCTGNVENLNNSCQPDTGGPLIMELKETFYVVGLTAFGLPCSDLPSVYTRVSSYIDWIEQIVWPKLDIRFDKK